MQQYMYCMPKCTEINGFRIQTFLFCILFYIVWEVRLHKFHLPQIQPLPHISCLKGCIIQKPVYM